MEIELSPSRNDTSTHRVDRLIGRSPPRLQTAVRWLRKPSARWVRLPAGVLLILGSLLSILPIFGLWMLPLGLLLLAEDVPPLRWAVDRLLAWLERKRPDWFEAPRTVASDRSARHREKAP